MENIKLVGGDSDTFQKYLENDDPCFGRKYDKHADACKECNAMVISKGILCPLSSLCRARSRGAKDVADLHRLTSADVLSRLQEGASVQELFEEILNGADPEELAQQARTLLSQRLRYLSVNKGIPTPDVPYTKDLMEEL